MFIPASFSTDSAVMTVDAMMNHAKVTIEMSHVTEWLVTSATHIILCCSLTHVARQGKVWISPGKLQDKDTLKIKNKTEKYGGKTAVSHIVSHTIVYLATEFKL